MDGPAFDRLFVLGASRGGTTLVGAALGAHSRIAMIDEDYSGAFDQTLGGKIPANKSCVPNLVELDKRRRWYHAFGRWNGTFRKSLVMEHAPLSSYCLQDFIDKGRTQFVSILRHPDRIIDSIQRRERRSLRNGIYRCSRWMEVADHLQHTVTPRPIVINFDTFVQDAEGSLRVVCERLALPFEDDMLKAACLNDRYRQSAIDPTKAKSDHEITYAKALGRDAVDRYHGLLAEAVV